MRALLQKITGIVEKVIFFFLLLAIVLVCFTHLFYNAGYFNSDDSEDYYGSLGYVDTLMQTYMMFFSNIEPPSEEDEVLLLIFFFLVTFLLTIVLFNVLIAIIGDVYAVRLEN